MIKRCLFLITALFFVGCTTTSRSTPPFTIKHEKKCFPKKFSSCGDDTI